MQQEILVINPWSEQIHWTPRLHWVGRLLAHGFYTICQQRRCMTVTGKLAAQFGKLSRVARDPWAVQRAAKAASVIKMMYLMFVAVLEEGSWTFQSNIGRR